MRQIGAARVLRHPQVQQRIGLRPDHGRHFDQTDEVKVQVRMALHAPSYVLPQNFKLRRIEPIGETGRKQRSIVIAELGAEPYKLARKADRADRQRKDAQDVSRSVARDHDHGANLAARTDAALPGRKPIERLKDGAIGLLFEAAPVLLDRQ